MILNHCRLIPELSGGIAAEDGAIVIENGKIKAVYGQALVDTDTDILDCGGKTVMPGLIDAHTHLAGLRNYSPAQLKEPMSYLVKTCLFARRYLDYGYTTIRDCGTAMRVAVYVRDAIDQGLFVGPRVIASGKILTPTETPENANLYELDVNIDGADAATHAARKELAQRADFIKVLASGSALSKYGIPNQPIMLEEELRAIVRIAKLKNTYVAAHAHADGAIRMCVDCGVRTIEHASFISEETISALLQAEDCYLIPTLAAFYQNPATTSPEYMFLVKKLRDMLETSKDCIVKAYRAGLKMGFGTDSCCGMDQYEQGIEFVFRKEVCNMKNVDILMQATKNNAEILNIANETGEIKAGLSADLIVVDGNPDEDINVMTCRPLHVFMAGHKVK